MLLAPQVHQHIARAAVEASHLASRAQQREIGDAADVEDRGGLPGPRKARRVEGRHQRCALAAGGHVAAAEVADHGDAAQLGQQSTVHQLQRVAATVEFARPVAHRLPMGADRVDLRCRQAASVQQQANHLCLRGHQAVGGQRRAVQLVWPAAVQRQQFIVQRRWKGQMGVGPRQHLATCVSLGQNAIHAVQ